MNITKKSTPIGNIIRLDDVVLQSGNEEGFRELFRFYDKDIKKTDCDDSYIDYMLQVWPPLYLSDITGIKDNIEWSTDEDGYATISGNVDRDVNIRTIYVFPYKKRKDERLWEELEYKTKRLVEICKSQQILELRNELQSIIDKIDDSTGKIGEML